MRCRIGLLAMLFIYGTLREGGKNRSHLEGQVASSYPAYTLGKLYLSHAAPMLVLGGEARVVGELLVLREEKVFLERMDAFEKEHGYSRKEISVETATGTVSTWAYLPDRLPEDAIYIETGDYLKIVSAP